MSVEPETFDQRRHLQIGAAIGGILLLAGLCQLLWPAVVPVGDGFGWDGEVYGEVARDPARSFAQGLPLDRKFRILPSLLVHAALRATGAGLDNHHIVLGFSLLNLLAICGAVAIWTWWTAKVRPKPAWFAAVSAMAFINFLNIRTAYFDPVLTDVPGEVLSFALAALYYRRSAWLWLVFSLAMFTWPGAYLLTLPLLALRPWDLRATPRADLLGRLVVGAFVGAAALSIYVSIWRLHDLPFASYQPLHPGWLWLSIPVALVYAALAMQPTLARLPTVLRAGPLRALDFQKLALIAALVVLSRLLASGIPVTYQRTLLTTMFGGGNSIFMRAVVLPGIFLVGHMLYFGPLFAAAIVWFKPLMQRRTGPELAFAALGLFFLFNSESRHQLSLVPFWAVWLLELEVDLSWRWVAAIASACLLTTGFWLPLSEFQQDGSLLEFPNQAFFLHTGALIGEPAYFIGIAWLCASVAFFSRLRASRAVAARLPPARQSTRM